VRAVILVLVLIGAGCGGAGGTGGKGGASGEGGGAAGEGGAAGSSATAGTGGTAGHPAVDAHPEPGDAAVVETADTGLVDVGSMIADVAGGEDTGAARADAAPNPAGAILWAINDLKSIAGHAVTVLGAPAVIDTPAGKAVQFDGKKDALFVDDLPLAGLGQFTAEMIFRPDADGPMEQRVFHMQENPSDNRVLFETRVMNGKFFLDVVLQSAAGSVLLYQPSKLHPADTWYAVAVVVDGKTAHTYVDGVEQFSANIGFRPLQPGRTSIGVRITKTSFFKGAIRLARFTPRPLTPAELLSPDATP
jgi:hypothetical protein